MSNIQEHITATKLARNLSTMIDRVQASGTRIAITRGNRQVAQLIPPTPEGASTRVLKALLDDNLLTPAAKTTYAKDLDKIRNMAKLPPPSWEL